jgi:predicted dienelactone hydrolase
MFLKDDGAPGGRCGCLPVRLSFSIVMLLPTPTLVPLAALVLVAIASIARGQSERVLGPDQQPQDPAAAAKAADEAQANAVDRAKPGPLAVETVDLDLPRPAPTAGAPSAALPLRVHFPTTGGPYPVVLFSHGFGGDRSTFAPIGQHWASHGYVVIHASHADGLGRQARSNDDSGAPEAPAGRARRGGLLGGLNDPTKISGRVGDLVLVLDHLDELPKRAPGLAGRIDAKAVAAAGHSFGAYTAMLLGGVTADLGKDKAKSFRDERVQCVLAISGQGTGQQGLTATSWEPLQRPMMTITGTRDRGAGGQGVDWKKEPFLLSPPGDKYLVVIDGANHMSFGGALGPRGSAITDVVKRCTTRFLDAYLKAAEPSKQYLQSDALAKDSAGKCAIEHK